MGCKAVPTIKNIAVVSHLSHNSVLRSEELQLNENY